MLKSPIEMMVDEVVGFSPPKGVKRTVLLECPDCTRKKTVNRQRNDLPETARVVVRCPKCVRANGVSDEVAMYNLAGKRIRV